MFDKIIDVLLYIPRQIFSYFVDGLIYLVNLIPAPDFLTQINLNGFSSSAYFLDVLSFDVGMTILLSSLVARFFLRRIPFIGG